jgi:hypothetical protein
MTPQQKMRAIVDRMNKQRAARAPLPTGGDNRVTEEALNTGAAARGRAQMATVAPPPVPPQAPPPGVSVRRRGPAMKRGPTMKGAGKRR